MSFCSSTPDTGVGSAGAGLSGLKTPGRFQDAALPLPLTWLLGGDLAAVDTGAALAADDRDDLVGLPPSAAAAAWAAFSSSLPWMREWRCMLPLVVKDILHTLHLNGRSPEETKGTQVNAASVQERSHK